MGAKIRRSDDRATAQRLLDAAEQLFGEHGYDGVGMRMLAQRAKVNLAATTYHFGSKKALYIETFTRRLRANNAARLKLLQEAKASAHGAPLTVEQILDCMARPIYLMGLSNPNFHALLSRSFLTPPPFLRAVLLKELEPNTEIFIAELLRSLPDYSEDVIKLRVAFSMGSLMMFSSQMGRLRTAPNENFEEAILKELVRFIASGVASEPTLSSRTRLSFPSMSKSRRAS